MVTKRHMLLATLACILGMFVGCSGQRPFLTVQICLKNNRGVVTFMDTMRTIAVKERMQFIDGGALTQKSLADMNVSPEYQLIYIGVKGDHGISMEGGNMGLSAYEVALGFSGGSNPSEAHRFAGVVVEKLRQKWPVYAVPPGHGATSMKDCAK